MYGSTVRMMLREDSSRSMNLWRESHLRIRRTISDVTLSATTGTLGLLIVVSLLTPRSYQTPSLRKTLETVNNPTHHTTPTLFVAWRGSGPFRRSWPEPLDPRDGGTWFAASLATAANATERKTAVVNYDDPIPDQTMEGHAVALGAVLQRIPSSVRRIGWVGILR